MNLLFITPQLPHPPRQGTAIRNWGLIKSLAARHRISLLTFAAPTATLTPDLRAACPTLEAVSPPQRTLSHRLRDLLFSPRPDLAHRLRSPEFSARLNTMLNAEPFEAIFVEGLELAPYLLGLKPSALNTIFDAHNCETVLQQRAFETDVRSPRRWPAALYSFIQCRRLAHFESQVCCRADHVSCVSTEDAAALRGLTPTLNPRVVPNGIFLSDYEAEAQAPTPNPQVLVFSGKMDYRPNIDAVIWFAHDILPLIQRAVPDTQFFIVGQKPVEAVRRLTERTGVVVTGAVDDIRPYVGRAAVYVAPLRMGGGTRFKLLEVMALRRPIVSTTLGAEGFAVQPGREILLADTPADFANATLELLRSAAKRQALSEAGYEFVQGYDWERLVPQLEALLTQHP